MALQKFFLSLLILLFSQSASAVLFSAATSDSDSTIINLAWSGVAGQSTKLTETTPTNSSHRTIASKLTLSGSLQITRAPGSYTFHLYRCFISTSPYGGASEYCLPAASQTVPHYAMPTLSITVPQTQLTEGGSLPVTWSSTNATSCQSAQISGVNAVSGTALYYAPTVLSANTTVSISITCSSQWESKSSSISLNVIAVNDAPTISPISNLTINEDNETHNIGFTISDEETPVSNLSLTASSSNTTLLPSTGITLGGTGSNRTVKLKPAANKFGMTTITVTVSDGSLTTSRSFVLNVNPVNDLPIISAIGNISMDTDDINKSISFTVSDIETPAASLAITATSSNQSLLSNSGIKTTANGGAITLVITPKDNATGSASITVNVTDGDGGTASKNFQLIRVLAPPPPTVYISSQLTKVAPGEATIIDWSSLNATSCQSSSLTGVNSTVGSALFRAPQNNFSEIPITITCSNGKKNRTQTLLLGRKNLNDANSTPRIIYIGVDHLGSAVVEMTQDGEINE